MEDNEDTYEWLGLPSPLEMAQQFTVIFKDEILELRQQLRKARSDAPALIAIHTTLQAERDAAMASLRERTDQLALVRKELYQLEVSTLSSKRDAYRLREMFEDLIPHPRLLSG